MNSQAIYVLLVEDDINYSALLRRRLMGGLNQDSDLTFVVAQTGLLNEAVAYIGSHDVDVVVLDLNLPDSAGLETLVRMRQAAPQAATIVLTGREDQELASEAIKVGAQDYLFKGNFNTELLIRAIRYAIDRKQSEEALSQVEEKLRKVNGHSPTPADLPATPQSEMSSKTLANDFSTLLARMAAQNSLALSELPTDNPARIHVEKLNQTIHLASDLTRRLFNGLRGSSQL